MATTPYEIVAGPADVYVAAVNTAFPDVDDAPNGSWTLLVKTEGGVKVKHSQSIELLRADQSTGPLKAIRSEEMLEVATNLAELTLENFALLLNDVTVTTAAGPPAIKSINLWQGFDVAQFALLVRGPSPYGDFELQYEIPIVVQVDEPEAEFVRDNKAVLAAKWTALEDPDAATPAERFGRLVAQTA